MNKLTSPRARFTMKTRDFSRDPEVKRLGAAVLSYSHAESVNWTDNAFNVIRSRGKAPPTQ
ncbi:hypothetical protein [Sorangium cellulosum]|uniref:hypothetical protein n=1 Tax=Sorangium cellulosum TaxID=56 RepID=UPI001331C32F|nr:hypothetical protein [Sorangium cellulosum]